METSDLVYGVIIAILLIVIWYICVSWPRETFTDKNGKSITDAQLLTILGNGYYFANELPNDNVPSTPNDAAIVTKLESAYRSILELGKKFNNLPNQAYNSAFAGEIDYDDHFLNMSQDANKALYAYGKNRSKMNIPVLGHLDLRFDIIRLRMLYSVLFDAVYNKYINTAGLNLSSVSIDDLNISGLPY